MAEAHLLSAPDRLQTPETNKKVNFADHEGFQGMMLAGRFTDQKSGTPITREELAASEQHGKVVDRSSTNEREDYWGSGALKDKTIDARMREFTNKWAEGAVKYNKSLRNTDGTTFTNDGEARYDFLKKIGVDLDTFNQEEIGKFYKKYFQVSDEDKKKESQLYKFASGIAQNSSEEIIKYADDIAWIGLIFGKEASKDLVDLSVGLAKFRENPDTFVENVNNKRNILETEDKSRFQRLQEVAETIEKEEKPVAASNEIPTTASDTNIDHEDALAQASIQAQLFREIETGNQRVVNQHPARQARAQSVPTQARSNEQPGLYRRVRRSLGRGLRNIGIGALLLGGEKTGEFIAQKTLSNEPAAAAASATLVKDDVFNPAPAQRLKDIVTPDSVKTAPPVETTEPVQQEVEKKSSAPEEVQPVETPMPLRMVVRSGESEKEEGKGELTDRIKTELEKAGDEKTAKMTVAPDDWAEMLKKISLPYNAKIIDAQVTINDEGVLVLENAKIVGSYNSIPVNATLSAKFITAPMGRGLMVQDWSLQLPSHLENYRGMIEGEFSKFDLNSLDRKTEDTIEGELPGTWEIDNMHLEDNQLVFEFENKPK